jgi:TetR/AcrR family transcriptional regulator
LIFVVRTFVRIFSRDEAMRAALTNSQNTQSRSTYDRRLEYVLERAALVFAEKGYHRASMRDLARATGMSLAGHYYYFQSKEEALFRICDHVLRLIVESFEDRAKGLDDPLERLRLLVSTHLEISLSHMPEMKVLSHEADSLRGEYLSRIRHTKKRYYEALLAILREIRGDRRGNGRDLRLAALTLFGSMNWIYTWYRPEVDGDARRLADCMLGIFLRGFLPGARAKGQERDGAESPHPVAVTGLARRVVIRRPSRKE